MERPYQNKDSSRQDEHFDYNIQKGLSENAMNYANKMDCFMTALFLKTSKPIIFLVESSEIIEDEIRVLYFQEDDPEELESTSDRIKISVFAAWLTKNRYNVISMMAHVGNVYTEKTKEYDSVDLIHEPMFDRDYYLELYLIERGW